MRDIIGSDLDRKVTIYLKTGVSVDANKYETATYDAGEVLPAKIEELPQSKEVEISGGILYDSVIHVIIRYRSDFESPEMKLKYKGKMFDVIGVREGHQRRKWLILKCVFGGKHLNR